MMSERVHTAPDVFIVRVADFFPNVRDGYSLVYSPETKQSFIVDAEHSLKIVESFTGVPCGVTEIDGFVESVLNWSRAGEMRRFRDKVETLAILPTSKCNFRCGYCYASHCRDGAELSIRQVEAVGRAFFASRRGFGRRLNVSIMGGGEPTMWEPLRESIVVLKNLAVEYGVELDFQLVTNGSLLTNELMRFLRGESVVVVFSFELLERVQNMQRGFHDVVCGNLDTFLRVGGRAVVRSTITLNNVDLQEEMVYEAAKRHGGIEGLVFEPVVDVESFPDAVKLRSFLLRFEEGFFRARKCADGLGLKLTTSLLRRVDAYSERYCNPEWSLCPNGKISICHRTSSDVDSGFAAAVFGSVDAGGAVDVDEMLLEKIAAVDANGKAECANCFARWNCGGGCRAQNRQYTAEMKAVRCEAGRRFLCREIIDRLGRTMSPRKDPALLWSRISGGRTDGNDV